MNVPIPAIIGGGSWGTALARIFSHNAQEVLWWVRNPESVAHIREHGHNPHYLRSVQLNTDIIRPDSNLAEVVSRAGLVVFATPSAFLMDCLSQLSADDLAGKWILSAIKGIEPSSQRPVSALLQERFGVHADHIGMISGPCHAEEVGQEMTAYLTVGTPNPLLGAYAHALMHTDQVRINVLEDTSGLEWAAVMKNIYSVAAGIAIGLNEGDNFKAVLVSYAAREMSRFLQEVSPGERDICHSGYLGDLLVTAYSQHSRNRTFGTMLGRGYSVKAAQLEMNMIAEGYYAANSIATISRKSGLNVPLADAVYRIIYEQEAPALAFQKLRNDLN